MINTTNRVFQEEFLVVDSTKALYNTANTTTTHLNAALDFTAASPVKLEKNQLGVFQGYSLGSTPKLNESVVAANNTYSKAPVIQLLQGTGLNPNKPTLKYPLMEQPFEKVVLNGKNPITVTYEEYKPSTYATWVFGGNATGAIAGITPATEYGITVKLNGKQIEKSYSTYGIEEKVTVTTPTTLPAAPINWVLQNIAWNYNSMSGIAYPLTTNRLPLVVLPLNYGAAGGVDISALTTATFVPLMETTVGTKGIYFSAEQITSIQASLSTLGLPAATHIVKSDKATFGTGSVDGLMFLALDRDLVYEDYVGQIKNNIHNVGSHTGFDSNVVLSKKGSFANEGLSTRMLYLKYRKQAQQKKYNYHQNERNPIEFPNPIDLTKTYSVFNIVHSISTFEDNHTDMVPFTGIIAVESGNTGFISGFTTWLNTWLTSANQPTIVNL